MYICLPATNALSWSQIETEFDKKHLEKVNDVAFQLMQYKELQGVTGGYSALNVDWEPQLVDKMLKLRL